jgi:hypothetical protein
MLELRLVADPKRMAAMRDVIGRECERTKAGTDHAAEIALVIEQLVDADDPLPGRRALRSRGAEVFVIVTVQSDATMLMVRDTRRERNGLGDRRQRVLREHTTGWSTMAGPDGRTVWAEIARTRTPALPQTIATRSSACNAPPVVMSA